MNSLLSKSYEHKECLVSRNFLNHAASLKKNQQIQKFESKKTLELEKHINQLFSKSLINRVGLELYDYERTDEVHHSTYIPQLGHEWDGFDFYVKSFEKYKGEKELDKEMNIKAKITDEGNEPPSDKDDTKLKEIIIDQIKSEPSEHEEASEMVKRGKEIDHVEKTKGDPGNDAIYEKKNKDTVEETTGEDGEPKLKVVGSIFLEDEEDPINPTGPISAQDTEEPKIEVKKSFINEKKNEVGASIPRENEEQPHIEEPVIQEKQKETKEKDSKIEKNSKDAIIEIKFNEDFMKPVEGTILPEPKQNYDSILLDDKKKRMNLMNYILHKNNIYVINNKNLIVGDIVYLIKGDVIPADGFLLQGSNMIVDESEILQGAKKRRKVSLDDYMDEIGKKKKNELFEDRLRNMKKTSYLTDFNLNLKNKLRQMNQGAVQLKNKLKMDRAKERKSVSTVEVTDTSEQVLQDSMMKDQVEERKTSGSISVCAVDLKNDGSMNGSIKSTTMDFPGVLKKSESAELGKKEIKKIDKYIFGKKRFDWDDSTTPRGMESPVMLSGSFVSEGKGMMIVTCVGKNKRIFHSSFKNVEENTKIEDSINDYTKNVVIIIIFFCAISIFCFFVHLIVRVVQNDMQIVPHYLLIIILQFFILEMLKFFLLSIDQLPLLFHNCIATYRDQMLHEGYTIKKKNVLEKALLTNILFMDIDRYVKYKCIYFFHNNVFYHFTTPRLIYSNRPTPDYVKLYDRAEHDYFVNTFSFSLLIQNILITSNLYQQNIHFLPYDLALVNFLKGFEVPVEQYYIDNKHLVFTYSDEKDYVISLFHLQDSFLEEWKTYELSESMREQMYTRTDLSVLRICVKGYASKILSKCSYYMDENNLRSDFEVVTEQVNHILKEKHTLLCFAYKDILICDREKEEMYIRDEFNSESHKINPEFMKNLDIDNLTCISIIAFEKQLSKDFFIDYKLSEENGFHIKLFTKENLDTIQNLFDNMVFSTEMKWYDAIQIHSFFSGKKSSNSYGSFQDISENNVQLLEKGPTNSEKNPLDYHLVKPALFPLSNAVTFNEDEINLRKCKSAFLNIEKYDCIIHKNEQRKMKNLLVVKQIYKNLTDHNLFYNCSNRDVLSILTIYNLYEQSILVSNENYVLYGKCCVSICDTRSCAIHQNKSDVVLLQNSIYDFIKLKRHAQCIFTNVKLYLEYNIIFYCVFLIFSIVYILVNGVSFMNLTQVLYMYFIKNIIIHYISCYRRSNCSVSTKKSNSFNFFTDIDMNQIISLVISMCLMLILVFSLGHFFIPESPWVFVTPELREMYDFSEFSFNTGVGEPRFYRTIRSCIRFKKNIENLKIEGNFDIAADFRTMNEWETNVSPSRHDTILFNIFFLFFYFYFLFVYIRTFLVEVTTYYNKYEEENCEFLHFVNNKEKKIPEPNIKRMIHFLKREGRRKSYFQTISSAPVETKEEEPKDTTEEETEKKEETKEKEPITQSKSIYDIPVSKNIMLKNCLQDNWITFLVLLIILIIHIAIIQWGSYFFHIHKEGLTWIQWLFCILFCLLMYVIYFLLACCNIFKIPTKTFQFFDSFYEPQEKNVFDAMNDLKQRYNSQRYKYDVKRTRKSWA